MPNPTRCRLGVYGNISAGGDGIDAESKAVAIAKVDQEAEQRNENSQETSGGNDSQFVQQQAKSVAEFALRTVMPGVSSFRRNYFSRPGCRARK